MSSETIFRTQLVLGYAAWLLCFGAYIWPWLRSAGPVAAQRAIATLHSFRFFGLVFILPGMVGADVPAGFTAPTAYGDLATGLLAMLALAAIRIPALFWSLVVAFNLVGAADLLLAYYHAITLGLPARAGELGPLYWIPVLYVPALAISHGIAFYLLLRQVKPAQGRLGGATS